MHYNSELNISLTSKFHCPNYVLMHRLYRFMQAILNGSCKARISKLLVSPAVLIYRNTKSYLLCITSCTLYILWRDPYQVHPALDSSITSSVTCWVMMIQWMASYLGKFSHIIIVVYRIAGKFGELILFEDLEKVWRINRSANRFLINCKY